MTTELPRQSYRFSPLFSCPGKKHKQDNCYKTENCWAGFKSFTLVQLNTHMCTQLYASLCRLDWGSSPSTCREFAQGLWLSGRFLLWRPPLCPLSTWCTTTATRLNSAWIVALTPPVDLNEAKPSGFESSSSPLLSGLQVCLHSL